jgi:phosphatidylinositol dimannoside acyltransferase
MLETARDRAIGFGYTAGWSVVKSMPRAMSARAFRAAADASTVRNGVRTRQLRKNLRRVVGPAMSELRMDTLVGEALRSYSRYWLETFRLEAMDHAAVAANFDQNMTGAQHLDAALEGGKGAIMALPHSGNWDASGIWLVHHSGPFTTVAERLKPESLYERFVSYRESLGFEILPMTGGESPVRGLIRALRANRVVCLLADRDLSAHGVPVTFFGAPTSMPPGPATLAAATGAALMPVACWFTDDGAGEGWGFRIHPPIEVPDRSAVGAATQAVADAFAGDIAEHPADWHMLQRLWPDQH